MQKATQVLCSLPGREQCSSGGAVKKFLNGTKKFPKGNGKIMGEKRELYLQKKRRVKGEKRPKFHVGSPDGTNELTFQSKGGTISIKRSLNYQTRKTYRLS